ncbi:MAG: hypothetical protein IJC46_06630 [Clostridia bacterium]|nr:hypothetical protein [Clostridia bacterium]
MTKKILVAITCILVLLLSGCSSESEAYPKLTDTFTVTELNRSVATELLGAFSISGPTADYAEGERIPYKQALPYFLHYGFYSGGSKVRTELEQYKTDKGYVIPAEIVDTYITSHFPTLVNHDGIDSYDEESDAYILNPVQNDGSKFYMEGDPIFIRDNVYDVQMRDTDPADPKIGSQRNVFKVRLMFDGKTYQFLSYTAIGVNYIRPDQSDADESGIHWYSPALPANQTLSVINDGFKETENGCQVTEDGGKTFTDVLTRAEALELALKESQKARYDYDQARTYVATAKGTADVELIRIESTYDPYWKPDWESDRYDFKADPLLWMVKLADEKEANVNIYIYLDVVTGEVMGAGTNRD